MSKNNTEQLTNNGPNFNFQSRKNGFIKIVREEETEKLETLRMSKHASPSSPEFFSNFWAGFPSKIWILREKFCIYVL